CADCCAASASTATGTAGRPSSRAPPTTISPSARVLTDGQPISSSTFDTNDFAQVQSFTAPMVDWDDKTKLTEDPEAQAASAADCDRACRTVRAGNNVGEMYKVAGEQMIIGRGQNAEIQIIDEGISRRHARVFVNGQSVLIEDCGSTNGTFLNG